MDAVVAAVAIFALYGVELVDAEYGYVAERNLALIVAINQFAVESYRSATRSKAEHEGLCNSACLINEAALLVALDALNDLVGNVANALALVAED